MAKRRKNLGKVKRYRRSFTQGPSEQSGSPAAPVLLAALFLAGWLIGPAVIDFGTSTWYRLKRGVSPRPVRSRPRPPRPRPPPARSRPPGHPRSPCRSWARAVGLCGNHRRQGRRGRGCHGAAAGAGGIKYAVLPLKDSQGYVYYPSGAAAAQGSIAATHF